ALLDPETYKLWVAPLRAHGRDGDSLVLEVANEFSETWVKENYGVVLQEALTAASGRHLEIRFLVQPNGSSPPTATGIGAPAVKRVEPPRRSDDGAQKSEFNPKSRFETFVVGTNNSFAHAAAFAVAQAPGKAYNPLFVYGGVGLGKTHLLHAIGHEVATLKPGAHTVFMSCEQFTNAYIEAIQNNQLNRFRKKCRQADVLLIDDVQFLAGKERIQEEFFHTFNALQEAGKQIVLTCDRPVSDLRQVEQKLVSRFEGGLITDLQPPDAEVRLAILRKKAACMGVEVPGEILSFLADRIRTNIRRLEGALNRVVSFGTLIGGKLSVEIVEGLLREILHEEGRHGISIEAIQKKVAEHFDIRLADMTSRRRPEAIAFPRQIAMFFSRQMTDCTLNFIGEAFGGRDHGTVLHACKLVRDRMEVDSHIRE
ncbi:MAG: chromosomal replication initiator protein DnaA, partial [Limisphaerales bacterium]